MFKSKHRWYPLLLVVIMLIGVTLACSPGGDDSGDSSEFQEGEDTGDEDTGDSGDSDNSGDSGDSDTGEDTEDQETEEPTEEPTPTEEPASGISASNADEVTTLRTLSPGGGASTALTSVAFSPDNVHVATYGWSKIVTIWDVTTGNTSNELSGPTEYGLGLDFSDDGSKLGAAGADYRVHVWDATDFSKITTIQSGIWANRLAFAPDGSYLVVAGTSSSSFKVYDSETGAEQGSVKPTGTILWSVNVSPDGQYIAAGTNGGGVFVYDAESLSQVAQLEPTYTDGIIDIEFSADGKYVAVGFDEGDVGVWTTDNWSRIMTTKALSATFSMGGLMDMAFSSDGTVIFAAGGEGNLVIIETEGGGVLNNFQQSAPIWGLDVSGDGSMIALALDNGDLVIVGLPQ